MFDRFISFLRDLDKPKKTSPGADDPVVAAAALMFHVVNADGVLEEDELVRLRELLASAYDLSGEALDRIVEAGEAADREAIDFYAFTSVLNRHLDMAAKHELVGLLWEMVYADGRSHELEDDTVWRVAELLDVENRDRVELRRRAQNAHQIKADESADP